MLVNRTRILPPKHDGWGAEMTNGDTDLLQSSVAGVVLKSRVGCFHASSPISYAESCLFLLPRQSTQLTVTRVSVTLSLLTETYVVVAPCYSVTRHGDSL